MTKLIADFDAARTHVEDCAARLEELLAGDGAPLTLPELRGARQMVQACFDVCALVAESGNLLLRDLDEIGNVASVLADANANAGRYSPAGTDCSQ